MVKSTKRKLRFIAITVAGIFILLYLSAQFWVSFRLNPFVDSMIKNGVIKASDSLYSISYRKISFVIATKTLVLKDVNFKADTSLYNKRKAKSIHVPSGLISFHLDELKLTGIEFYEALITHNLEAGNIMITNPVITLTLFDSIERRDTLETQKVYFDMYKLFSEKFHSLTINKITVKNAAFKLFKSVTDTQAIVSSNGIQIEVSKLKIDSAYSINRYEIDLAQKIKIKIADAHWILPDSIYRVQFSNLDLDAATQSLSFEKIQVVALADKYKISAIRGYAADLIQMTMDSLRLQHLNMNLLLYNHNISCGQAEIQNFNLNSFRFKNAPRKSGYRELPLEQLRWAPLMIHIDSIAIKNGRVEYGEQVPEKNFPGVVFFSNISGSVFNINNDWESLMKNNLCRVSLSGLFMGKGKMKINAAFNQTSAVDSFRMDGYIGKMELNSLNAMIQQSANVKLETGTLDALAFNISGTKNSASGNMTLLYHDLTVLFMKNETDDAGKQQMVAKKNIKSFLTNSLAIVPANPMDSVVRSVKLFKTRDPEKYIFNYVWQTLLSGIKETMLTSRMKKGKETLKDLAPKVKEMLK